MTPGSNTVRGVLFLAGGAVGAAIVPEVSIAVLAGLLILAAVALAEASQLRQVRVHVSRPEKVAISLGETATYEVVVSSSAHFPIALELRQTWPGVIDLPSSSRSGICRPGETVRLEFSIRGVARGVADVPAAHVRITRHAFADRIVSAGGAAWVAVTPNTAAVARLHKELNQLFLRGYGSRTASRLGKGREFDRMRDYVRGDELRDVAWRTTARHAKLIVREYRLDRSQDILVCLDIGHRMAARVGQISRLDHAVNAAMLVAYVCNRMEDRVGILSFSADVARSLPPGRGMPHLRELTKFATAVRPHYQHTDYMGLASDLRRRLRHRSLILLMTVLPEVEDHRDLIKAVRMLAPQHVVLVIVFADMDLKAATEFRPSRKRELARTLVARELADSHTSLIRELRGLGALVVETPPDKLSIESVNAYLDVKRRQLL